VLVQHIVPHVRAGDRILDIGCGSGALGGALLRSAAAPEDIAVTGLELEVRRDSLIPVTQYDGTSIPYPDRSLDIVILADVLHHAVDPHGLLAECVRVARRVIIIKDHVRRGWLSVPLLRLLDWAANKPYGVRCLYRYNTPADWQQWHRTHGLTPIHQLWSMRLYPPLINPLFGNRLQYFAVLSPNQGLAQ
jgi:ubiquinone/menaquinone biosynthesis C-methylase UbiE